jgi:amidase
MFSTHGPLARTVADAAAMLDVLAGPQPGDWFAAPAPQRPFRDEVDASPGRLRVAWSCLPPAGGREVGAANCTGAEDAATLLAELGHDVEEDAPDWGPNPVTSHAILRAVELLRIADMPSDETLAEATRRALEWGRNTTAGGYLEALEEVQARSRRVVPFFDRYDLLVTPTLGTQPPRVGELAELTPETMIRFGSMSMFTSIWNDTGQPAFSVPLYTDDDGMPVGVQLVGRPNDEATLFRVAAQLEAALPWTARRPPVS